MQRGEVRDIRERNDRGIQNMTRKGANLRYELKARLKRYQDIMFTT